MAETKTKVATIRGTLLKVGVSKNKRLYTAENIKSAAEAAKSDLAAGKTLNMYTTHMAAAKDDPMSLIGKFTNVWQEDDGSLKFEAEVPNTTTGRDYANLAHGGFQRTISIRGGWGSTPTIEDFNGQKVLTAPTLRLGGADGTASPGVEGATIEGIDFLDESNENFDPAIFMDITESVEVELVPFTEEIATPSSALSEDVVESLLDAMAEILEKDPKEPYGAVTYADPGYQADKKKRYPLDSEEHVKSAWSYINVSANGSKYSSAQLARIKGKIKSAAKKYGINIGEWYADFVASLQETLEVSGIESLTFETILGSYFPDPDADPSPEESTATTDQETEAAEQQMICPGCGKSVSALLPECPYCQGSLSQVESADNTEETTNKETTEMSETNTTAETADTAPAPESVPAVPTIDYKALATEMLAQQKAAADVAEKEAAEAAAIEAAKPVTFSNEEVQALVAAATETATAEATAKALEEARRSGKISRVGHTTEAATPYYESIQESEYAQETFLGHLDTRDLQKVMSAVLSDDRNLAGTAPNFAAGVRR